MPIRKNNSQAVQLNVFRRKSRNRHPVVTGFSPDRLYAVGSMSEPGKKFGPQHFINRELSWLEFNQRVLDEAMDRKNPLLERLKFFAIVSSNLDEFFEIRVASVKQQIESDVVERSVDGMTATETFRAVTHRVRHLSAMQSKCWHRHLVPELTKNGIRFLDFDDLDATDAAWIESYYRAQVRPVLTPMAIDPAHPFPQLLNKSLNIIVQLTMTRQHETLRHLVVVQVPRILPQLIKLPRTDGRLDYVFLGEVIRAHLQDLVPGTKILGSWNFRVTRNSELYVDAEEEANLLKAVENELHNRRRGDAVRLEVEKRCPKTIRAALRGTLRLAEEDIYLVDGPFNPGSLMAIYEGDHSPELRYPPFIAPPPPRLHEETDYFAAIRRGDILLHHPYENFQAVVSFLEQAADDPKVLAIKQTLYRTGGDPHIVGALMNAGRKGKQVTAAIELRARFDEANNIQWARQLEEAGVQVVYGLVGYKIHGKLCLVVRHDDDAIRRYVHLSTGNYNPTTARTYTDIGLLTCDADFGEDATSLFNLLTGLCQFQPMRRFLVAPFDLHERTLAMIQREAENARQGLPARIIAKMNSLVEQSLIEALYHASEAGVKIELIVRGICCLRPGLKGVSSNISVRSIVDRFLEHSRIFYFENGCRPEVFVGSADWMPRNFFRRVELTSHIIDGNLRERIMNQLLPVSLADNTKARFLRSDGTYRLPARRAGEEMRRSQFDFVALAGKKPNGFKAGTGGGRYPVVKLISPPSTASFQSLKKEKRHLKSAN